MHNPNESVKVDREALILAHRKKTLGMVHKLRKKYPSLLGIDREECEGVAILALVAAGNSFDPSRAEEGLKLEKAFWRFAAKKIKGKVLNALRQATKGQSRPSAEEPVFDDPRKEEERLLRQGRYIPQTHGTREGEEDGEEEGETGDDQAYQDWINEAREKGYREARRDATQKALAELSPLYRDLLTWALMEGKGYDWIAREAGMTREGVNYHLRQAKQEFKEAFELHMDDPG